MARLGPVLGNGRFYGNSILRGYNTYISDIGMITAYNVRIQFWSRQGSWVGDIWTLAEDIGFLDVGLDEDKQGGLKNFDFVITKKPEFSFFNQMDVRFYINNIFWFSGELLYNPSDDTRKVKLKYEGRGYSQYMKDVKIDLLYENKTVTYIANDLVQNYLADTPILYDPDLINLPNITVTKLELNNKTVWKAMERILEIVNYAYQEHQYTFGTDKYKMFYFQEIDRTVNFGFFEGYQYQNPSVKENIQKIINKINLFRTKEADQEVEPIATIEDTESQSKYGIKEADLTIADFVDIDTGKDIGGAKLSLRKDPIVTANIKDLEVDVYPYPIGFYHINNKFDTYTKLVTDNENLDGWDITRAFVTSISVQSEDVYSGSNSLKAISGSGSFGEYIQFDLDDEMMYPQELRFYLKQSIVGEKIFVTAYDDEGNAVSSGDIVNNKLLLEDGGFILLEDGGKIELENVITGIGIDVRILGDWFPYKLDISSITNVKSIRITWVTDETITFLFDRLELITKSWFRHNLVLDKIKYSISRNNVLSSMVLGESGRSLVKDIKEINEKNKTLFGIFEKQ